MGREEPRILKGEVVKMRVDQSKAGGKLNGFNDI